MFIYRVWIYEENSNMYLLSDCEWSAPVRGCSGWGWVYFYHRLFFFFIIFSDCVTIRHIILYMCVNGKLTCLKFLLLGINLCKCWVGFFRFRFGSSDVKKKNNWKIKNTKTTISGRAAQEVTIQFKALFWIIRIFYFK